MKELTTMKKYILSVLIVSLLAGIIFAYSKTFRAPKDSKILGVKKGQVVSQAAWEWNESQKKNACIRDGLRVACEGAYSRKPSRIPDGYCIVFYTSGCNECAVGWTFARGEYCKNCWNCMN